MKKPEGMDHVSMEIKQKGRKWFLVFHNHTTGYHDERPYPTEAAAEEALKDADRFFLSRGALVFQDEDASLAVMEKPKQEPKRLKIMEEDEDPYKTEDPDTLLRRIFGEKAEPTMPRVGYGDVIVAAAELMAEDERNGVKRANVEAFKRYLHAVAEYEGAAVINFILWELKSTVDELHDRLWPEEKQEAIPDPPKGWVN